VTVNKRILCSFLGVLIILVGISIAFVCYDVSEQKKDEADATALCSVIAEAYININDDREFVNTATKDVPMEVPEKYYTYVESVQGDGRVYVFVDLNGSVSAYFGTPEKIPSYYVNFCG